VTHMLYADDLTLMANDPDMMHYCHAQPFTLVCSEKAP